MNALNSFSKWYLLNSRQSLAVGGGFVIACSLLGTSLAWGTTNPLDCSVPVSYRNTANGPDVNASYSQKHTATLGGWWPQFKDWNNRKTNKGHKIENFDLPAGFPFQNGADNVTAEKCKFYWDAHLGAAWKFVSNATCVYNCYGYATGKNYWIQPAGFNVLVQDEYDIDTDDLCKGGCINKKSEDHALRFDECCPIADNPDTVKKASQKINTSPVYKAEIDCPPGDADINGTLYCKKK